MFLKGLSWHALPEAYTSLGNIHHLERSKLRRKQILDDVNAYMAKHAPKRAESWHAWKTDPVRASSSSSTARTPRVPSRAKKLSIDTQEMPPTVTMALPLQALQSVSRGWRDTDIDPRVRIEASQAHGLEWIVDDAVSCSTMQLFELEVAFSRKSSVEAIFFTRTPPGEQAKAEDESPAQQDQIVEESKDEGGELDKKNADTDEGSKQGLLSWMPGHVREGAEKCRRIVTYSIADNGEGVGEFAAHAYASICAVVGANYALRGYDVQQRFDEQERMQRGMVEALVGRMTHRLETASSKEAASTPLVDEHESSQPNDALSQSPSLPPPSGSEAAPNGEADHDDVRIQQVQTLSSRRNQYVQDLASWVTSEEAQYACVVGLLKSRACGASFVSEHCAMLLETLWKAEVGGEQNGAERDAAKGEGSSQNMGRDQCAGAGGGANKEQERARPLKTCFFIRGVGVVAREIGPHILGQLRGTPPYTKADQQEFKCGNELHDLPHQLLSIVREQTIDVVCVIDGLTAGERLRLLRGAARACQVYEHDASTGSLKIVLADDALLARADYLMPPFVTHLPEPPVLEVCLLLHMLPPLHPFWQILQLYWHVLAELMTSIACLLA